MSGFVFGEKPIEIESGDGVHLYDTGGTEYLDMGASYACAPAGHCHPDVVSAVQEQAADLLFVQGSYPTPTRTALYDRLAGLGPGDCSNVWLCNSGTEANEAALKFARHATGREKVVAAKRAFHGRTLGSLAATWKQKYKDGFAVPDNVEFVDYGDADALADAVDDDTAAVLLEPIQGEGGVHAAPGATCRPPARPATRRARRSSSTRYRPASVGRATCGPARSGRGTRRTHRGEGLGSGLPIGATLCADWIAEDAGNHGSTFSGGPVPCAAALATLDVIEDEELAANAASVGSTCSRRSVTSRCATCAALVC